jgi:hypothetical protein
MILQFNDPSRTLEYIDSDGEVHRVNRNDWRYELVSARLEQQRLAVERNAFHRKQYEDSIAAGGTNIPAPLCESWPDDFRLPARVIPWNPPLRER